MARQAGEIRITGTVEGFCFYRMDGQYYVRRKSTLGGKRFQREAAFAGSRRSAALLAAASALASRLYRRLPPDQKARAVFQRLTGEVKRWLAQGWTEDRIGRWFANTCLPAKGRAAVRARKEKSCRCRTRRAERRLKKRRRFQQGSLVLPVQNPRDVGGGCHRRVFGPTSPRPSPRGEGGLMGRLIVIEHRTVIEPTPAPLSFWHSSVAPLRGGMVV